MALSLTSLGKHRYAIESLVDGAGNFFEPSLRPVGSANHIARSVDVIGRSSATFKNCGLASPVDLRKGGDATLVLAFHGGEGGVKEDHAFVEHEVYFGPEGISPAAMGAAELERRGFADDFEVSEPWEWPWLPK